MNLPQTPKLEAQPLPSANGSRSLLILSIGAIAGLSLAAYGLFTAPSTTLSTVPKGALALVNQRQILERDFVTQMKDVYGINVSSATNEQRSAVLESMIAEELLVQRGIELDLVSSDADVRGQLAESVRKQVATEAVASQPTESQLMEYFKTHRDRYIKPEVFRVRDFTISRTNKESEQTARQALQALRHGTPIVEVLRKFRLDETPDIKDSELNAQALKRLLSELVFNSVSNLSNGEYSDLVVSNSDIHIVLMMEHRARKIPDFSEMQSQVASDFVRDAKEGLLQEYVKFLRKKSTVLFAQGMQKE